MKINFNVWYHKIQRNTDKIKWPIIEHERAGNS